MHKTQKTSAAFGKQRSTNGHSQSKVKTTKPSASHTPLPEATAGASDILLPRASPAHAAPSRVRLPHASCWGERRPRNSRTPRTSERDLADVTSWGRGSPWNRAGPASDVTGVSLRRGDTEDPGERKKAGEDRGGDAVIQLQRPEATGSQRKPPEARRDTEPVLPRSFQRDPTRRHLDLGRLASRTRH